MIFWLPVGTVAGAGVVYMTMTQRNYETGQRGMSEEEAVGFISQDFWFFLLMSFTVSLAVNVMTIKHTIKSSSKKKSRWGI